MARTLRMKPPRGNWDKHASDAFVGTARWASQGDFRIESHPGVHFSRKFHGNPISRGATSWLGRVGRADRHRRSDPTCRQGRIDDLVGHAAFSHPSLCPPEKTIAAIRHYHSSL
jgi:hypothetical protein